MKKSLLFLLALSAMLTKAQPTSISFNLTNNTGSQSITCATPSINVTANTTFTAGPVVFNWVSANAILSGSNVSIISPGVYTVFASSSVPSFSTMQTISIGINTVVPSVIVSPQSQNITCLGAAVTVSALASPSINILHRFLSPYGGTVQAGSYMVLYTPGAPGTYTDVLMNVVNGCTVGATFSVTSTGNYPTFSLASPQNYMLGCASYSVASVMINNPFANGASMTFTLLPPTNLGAYGTGNATTYNVTTPGVYTVVVKESNSNCESKVPVSIIQNTFAPTPMVTAITRTLSCDVPSVTLQGSSNPANASFTWTTIQNGSPASVQGSSIAVSTTTAGASVPSASIIGNYSLMVIDLGNGCKSNTVITMYQNTRPPVPVIAGVNPLTCQNATVNLTNSSTSGILPNTFAIFAPIIGLLWQGPVPQTTLANISSYAAYTPGVYTLTVQDMNNGCTSSTTTVVGDNRVYPVVQTNPLVCLTAPNAGGVKLPALVVGQSASAVTAIWSTPIPAPNVSGLNTLTLTTDGVGVYTLAVTSNSTNCTTAVQVTVAICTGLESQSAASSQVRVFPNPNNGQFTLEWQGAAQPVTINVYNLLGVLVKSQLISVGNNEMDLRDQPNGVYLLHLQSGAGEAHTLRVIRQ